MKGDKKVTVLTVRLGARKNALLKTRKKRERGNFGMKNGRPRILRGVGEPTGVAGVRVDVHRGTPMVNVVKYVLCDIKFLAKRR